MSRTLALALYPSGDDTLMLRVSSVFMNLAAFLVAVLLLSPSAMRVTGGGNLINRNQDGSMVRIVFEHHS